MAGFEVTTERTRGFHLDRDTKTPSYAGSRFGKSAVVIGASMAGLLAARVLADFY